MTESNVANNKLQQDTIPFNFTYFAMKLLGRNLYSNPWTAVSEIVANGIDAKAPQIHVVVDMWDKEHAVIDIFDNGTGMSYIDLCEKYTLIGRNKRESSDNISGKTLGRKGIGKLAALYLSHKYYLCTKTNNESSTWVVDTSTFRDSDIPTLKRASLNDINFAAKSMWNQINTGTLIHLSDVDLRKIGEARIRSLPLILSDYYLDDQINSEIFVCVLTQFKRELNFIKVQKNIDYKIFYGMFDTLNGVHANQILDEVYLTNYRDVKIVDFPRKTVKYNHHNVNICGDMDLVDLTGVLRHVPYELSGWIGIHCSLDEEVLQRNSLNYRKTQYRSNSLRLYVRGKLAINDFMPYVASTQAFSNYIEGEISFDILDDDQFEDSSTSNREGYSATDPRIIKLKEIVSRIVSILISARVNIGKQINIERTKYFEELRKKEQEKAEEERKQKELALQELQKKQQDLASERKRNIFLKDTLTEDQVSFAQKLHMIRINNSSIETTIDLLVFKKMRNQLTIEDAWEGIKDISYCNERVKSVLDYCAIAKFDTKDERVTGDLFQFIDEYCESIIKHSDDGQKIKIITDIQDNEYICEFVPQNIGVLIENIVSNSVKNDAKCISVKMYKAESSVYIDIIDNGKGLSENADKDSIYEFGKSYTDGTGVGLYHVKQIAEELGGKLSLIDLTKGFGLRIKI